MNHTRSDLYPLRFEPIFRRYLWGGRRLQSVLQKPLGPGQDYAESWEIVDRGADQSVVSNGPLAGSTLADVCRRANHDFFGRHAPRDSFPLLLKFLDAHQNLSVQVHPNDAQAAQLSPPDRGKTEAWVIMDAQPGSKLYAGLKRGFDRPAVERELKRGTLHLCLHAIEPQVGDCIFVPAGTVHALGAGLLVAEIQQASDTTFRLFDWNRVGPDGRPRSLHIEQGLDVIDFQRGPVSVQQPQTVGAGRQRLVECPYFVLDRYTPHAACSMGGDERFHVLAVVQGEVYLEHEHVQQPLRTGDTVLLPASTDSIGCRVTRDTTPSSTQAGSAILLDAYLP